MKKYVVIIAAIIITSLNIKSYGKLDEKKIKVAKELALTTNEITLNKQTDWYFGLNFFKLIHVIEIMLIADIGRRQLIHHY